MQRISIKTKIISGFTLMALLPLLATVILGYINFRQAIVEERVNQLETVADLKVETINGFFQSLTLDTRVAQDYYNAKLNIPVLSSYLETPDAPEYIEAKKALDSQLKTLREEKGYLDVLLFDVNGTLVYTTGVVHTDDEVGTTVAPLVQEMIAKARSGVAFSEIFASTFAPSGFEILVAGTIEGLDRTHIGTVIFPVDMGPVYDLIQDTTGLGDTGETLIGKNNGDHALFLNTLRHDPEAALTRQARYGIATAVPMQEATQGRNGSGLTTDYRDVAVVGAWRHIPGQNWGLVAKIDADEAFAPLRSTMRRFLVVSITAFLVVAAVGFLTARSIVQPVVDASRAAREIESGNLDVTIDVRSKDEVGALAAAFNQMVESVKSSQKSLQKEKDHVEQKAQELEKNTQDLEKMNKLMIGRELKMAEMKRAVQKAEKGDRGTLNRPKHKDP